MSEPTLHQESLTSVAIDGARINCFLAINLVAMDPELDGAQKAELLSALSQAAVALDYARENFPVIITSLHHAAPISPL
jgi:hypothetical protein